MQIISLTTLHIGEICASNFNSLMLRLYHLSDILPKCYKNTQVLQMHKSIHYYTQCDVKTGKWKIFFFQLKDRYGSLRTE